MHLGPHRNLPFARGIRVGDGIETAAVTLFVLPVAKDDAARRKIGALDELHQVAGGDVFVVRPMVNGVLQGADDFAQVVGGDAGGHAHGDAEGAVDEQVGDDGRQNEWLLERIVEVGAELDGVFFDVGQQVTADGRHACLGVAHGRRRVPVYGAEIALTIYQ